MLLFLLLLSDQKRPQLLMKEKQKEGSEGGKGQIKIVGAIKAR